MAQGKKECPNCGKVLGAASRICECGYYFKTGKINKTELRKFQKARQVSSCKNVGKGRKECPKCKVIVGARTLVCPECGHKFLNHTTYGERAKTSTEVKAKTSPKVKAKTSPKVKAKTSPKVKAKTSPKVKAKTSPKVKAKTSPKVKAKTSPKAKASTKKISSMPVKVSKPNATPDIVPMSSPDMVAPEPQSDNVVAQAS